MAGSRLRCSEKASADTEEKGKGAKSTEPGELRKGLGLKSLGGEKLEASTSVFGF